jgi:hypothetical protein
MSGTATSASQEQAKVSFSPAAVKPLSRFNARHSSSHRATLK